MFEAMYNEFVTMSYQSFKKIRKLVKFVRNFSGICNLVILMVACRYNMSIPFGSYEPEIDPWISSLNGFQFMEVMTVLAIFIITMIMYSSMNHGKTTKLSYKAWCEEHDYVPFND